MAEFVVVIGVLLKVAKWAIEIAAACFILKLVLGKLLKILTVVIDKFIVPTYQSIVTIIAATIMAFKKPSNSK